MPIGLFGISNDGLNLAVNLLVLFLVVIWVALIAWTYLDARRRIEDPFLVACATAASLFPFVGTIVYSILRPPEFVEDKRERELETRAAELRVRQLTEQSCPNCEYPVERTYLRCPNCEVRLKDPCPACSKPLDPRWAMCPYCETVVRKSLREERGRAAKRRPRDDARRQRAEKARSDREQARTSRERQRAAARASAKSRGKRPAGGDGRGAPTEKPRSPSEKRSSSTSSRNSGTPEGRPSRTRPARAPE